MVGNVRMPCGLEQAVTSLCHGRGRPALQRGLESAGDKGGERDESQRDGHSPTPGAKIARLHPQHQRAAMKLDLDHQSIGEFFPPPRSYPMAFLIMILGINFAVIELSTFCIQSLCQAQYSFPPLYLSCK